MRALMIKDGWWREVDPKDEEEVKELLGAERLESPALKLGEEYYGCWCDADARTRPHPPDTVVMRIRDGVIRRRWRYFGYVAGPVIIYLNRGLSDLDVEFIRERILMHNDADRSPFLLVEDFRDMIYEETDP